MAPNESEFDIDKFHPETITATKEKFINIKYHHSAASTLFSSDIVRPWRIHLFLLGETFLFGYSIYASRSNKSSRSTSSSSSSGGGGGGVGG